MKKTEIILNRPVYLGLAIRELSKILMYEFWYDYVKPKYGEKPKLCYMDTGSFTVYTETYDIYKNIAEGVETRFSASNYELDRPLPKEKNNKVIGLMKDELGGKIMTKFDGLRAKTYSYVIYDSSEDKKLKAQTKCDIKRKLKLENYKNCLGATQLKNKINHLEKRKINIDSLTKS